MDGTLNALLGLGCFVAGWSLVCVPLFRFGSNSQRTLPWVLGIGAWSALHLAGAAFMWGASIPADNAGEAAMALAGCGALTGGPLAALAAWRLLVRVRKRPPEPADRPLAP